ncbi:MAG: amidohydrolase family protein, partial [Bacteroidota bacterium]
VLPMIEQARKKGVTISAETCPHYLYFSADKIPDHDTRFKCDPPIRDEANRNSLWTGLERGDLSFIVSDHRPAPAEMKEIETGHFTKSRSGIPSLQFTLPVCWTAAQSMKIPLGKLSFWMSTSVAERFGLDTKGVIKEGFDADLVIWNPAKKMKVNKHIIRSRHAYSPYEGEMLSGVVEETWVGGIKVYDRGDFPNKHSGKVLLKNLSL